MPGRRDARVPGRARRHPVGAGARRTPTPNPHANPDPDPSPDPSEQARDIATDALVKGKKVLLDYELTGVSITVTERDGSKHVSRLKWG